MPVENAQTNPKSKKKRVSASARRALVSLMAGEGASAEPEFFGDRELTEMVITAATKDSKRTLAATSMLDLLNAYDKIVKTDDRVG